jgi:hypothetical protein
MMAGGLPPLVLDLYPNSSAAYSLRKLRTAYSGNAIRVRRTSDNAEQNIGFVSNGALDTAALTTFCSGTNGFVTVFYDQTGNNRNLIQTTAINQPQIANAGTLYLQINNKPTMFFNNTTSFLSVSNFVPNTGNGLRSVFTTFKAVNLQGFLTHVFHTGLAVSNQAWGIATGTLLGDKFGNHYWSANAQGTITPVSNQDYVASSIYDGVFDKQFINGVVNLNNNRILNTGNGNTVVGSRINPYAEGSSFYFGEMIIYSLDQSTNRTGIETNIKTYFGIP